MVRIELLGIKEYHETEFLKTNLQKALRNLEIEADIIEISDIDDLVDTHIDGIPALVVNGSVLVQKRIPDIEELEELLEAFFKNKKSSNMKKIITSTDFSKSSMEGFQFALKIAKILDASVELIHVYSGAFSPDQPIVMQASPNQYEAVLRHVKNFETRGKEATQLSQEEMPEVNAKAVLGFPEVELVKYSNEEDTYMIVMSTSGSHGISGKLFGTISTHVGRKANCPVMLIPQGTEFKGFKHILYASNFEGVDEKNIRRLVAFAELFQANVHFVHVRTPKEAADNFKKVEASISELLFREGEPSFSFEMAEINSESITEGLNKYAENQNIDLVVMVSPHRHFLESLFHKSTTTAFAFNSSLPVLVLH